VFGKAVGIYEHPNLLVQKTL